MDSVGVRLYLGGKCSIEVRKAIDRKQGVLKTNENKWEKEENGQENTG